MRAEAVATPGPRAAAPGLPEEPELDLELLAARFVEQRKPPVSVDEVRSLFEQLMATAFAGATITQYLPLLLWRQAQDRWPPGAVRLQAASAVP